MIEHVQQGEKITADKQNQIIDAANGQNTPSDNFVNTGKGAIFPNGPAKETFNPTFVPPYIFQTKWCNTFRMTLRTDNQHDEYDLDDPKRSWYVYLGPDLGEIKNYVKRLFDITQSFKMYIMSKDSDTDVEINNDLLTAWPTGYVDTTFYDSKKISLMYVKTWYQAGTGPEMYPHWSVLITDANTDGEIASKLYDLIQEKEGQPQNKSQMLDICTIAKRNEKDKTFQYPFSPKQSTIEGIKTDSEISAAQLSSLQPYQYYDSETSSHFEGYEIWKFHDLSAVNNPWSEGEVSCYDIISRYKEAGDKPAAVRYIPLSSIGSNISVDSEIPNVKLSSLEHKIDGGDDYYQIYDFDDLENTKKTTDFHDISKVDIIVRNRQTNVKDARVEYLQLSSVLSGGSSVLTDTEDTDNQKSIEHNQIGGKKVLQLHNFHTGEDLHAMELDLENPKGKWDDEERRTFLVRHETDDGAVLEYADINLSSLSESHKADSEIPALQLSSLEHKTYSYVDEVTGKQKKTDYYQWFRFHDGNELCTIIFDKDHKSGFIEGSSADDTFTHPIRFVNGNNDRIVKYAVLSVNISSDPGDSNLEDETRSIEHVDDKFYRLYKFQTDEGHTLEMNVPDMATYYYNGDTTLSPTGSDADNMDVVVRNRNGAQFAIDYRKLSVAIPPFVHGDADDYPATYRKSIDSITYPNMPDKSFYQLHNWDYPPASIVNNDLISGDYYNLANGVKKGDDGDDNDYFLIRNNQGVLVYKKIYAKAESGGSWDEERIQNIENNINNVHGDIYIINEEIIYLSGTIEDLSSQIDGLSDDFWVKGGDYSDCYGSSIGDSGGNLAIDLDTHTLAGDWNVASNLDVGGDLEVGGNEIVWGNLTCNNGIYASNVYTDVISPKTGRTILIGETTDHNGNDITNVGEIKCTSIGGKNGDLKLDSDLDVNGHTIKNLDELDVQTQINVPIVNCTQVNSATGDVVNIGGSLNVTGSSIIVGGVTVTATQLQQLLALLNSSNNVLNQSF